MLPAPISSLPALLAMARIVLRRRGAALQELEISHCIYRPTARRTVDLVPACFLTASDHEFNTGDELFCETLGLIVPDHESGRLDDFLASREPLSAELEFELAEIRPNDLELRLLGAKTHCCQNKH